MLQCLRFHGADDVEPDRRRESAAQMIEEEHPSRRVARNIEPAEARAEDGSEVSESEFEVWSSEFDVEDPFHGGRKCSSLRAAGAIGDMVRGKGVAQLIEFGESTRFIVRGRDERQRSMAKLLQARFDEGNELLAVAHFAMLPGGFESGRVREATGRERRIS